MRVKKLEKILIRGPNWVGDAVLAIPAMKAVRALPDASDCSETIGAAGEYAAAKTAYYDAARRAVPALLQIAKGRKQIAITGRS